MRVIGDSSEDEMVACFLLGELTSQRLGAGIRRALAAAGHSEHLLTDADLGDPAANRARRDLLAVTRGYGEDRDALVCLEGHLRLTAHALAGFPVEVEYLVGTASTMDRWGR